MQAEVVQLPGWARWLALIVGIFALVIGITMLIFPDFGLALVVVLVSFALIILGIDRLITGIVGKQAKITGMP